MPPIYLPAAILLSAAVSTLMMLSLFYLQHLQIQQRATRCWALAYGCLALRHLCNFPEGVPVLAFAADFFLLGYACFLWAGIRIYHGASVYVMPVMLLFATSSLWLLMANSTGMAFFWRTLPVCGVAGGLLIGVAFTFWQMHGAQGAPAYLALTLLTFLRGAHTLDYPFLRNLTWFAPLGFGIGVLLDLAIGMSLLLAVMLRQQKDAHQVSDALRLEVQERKQAEQQSREREKLFEKVFQLVPDVLLICREKDGRYLEVNRHWEEVTGYSREETLGHYSLELNLWADVNQRDEMLQAIKMHGEVNKLEAVYRHKQGHLYHVRISGTRFDSGGEPYVMYVMRDVTAQLQVAQLHAQAESELREREQRFARIFELVPEAVSISRVQDGELVDVNRNWEVLLGYTREQSLGRRTVQDLGIWLDPLRREHLISQLERDTVVRSFETVLCRRDATVTLAEGYFSLLESGGQRYMMSALRDITEQRSNEIARERAENSLHESERQLRAVLNAMGEGVVVWNAHGGIVLCNAAALAIYGLSEDSAQLMLDDAVFRFRHEDGSPFQSAELPLWKTLESGESQKNVVLGIQRQDGGLKWMYVSTDPIFSETDIAQVEQVVISMVDISKLKQAEATLREREKVLATVFQLVPDTLTITRMDSGQYIEVNRNWEPLGGFTREEAIGHTSAELKLWAQPEQRVELVNRIRQDGEVRNMPAMLRHKDGHLFQCRVSGSKFESGDEAYLLLSAHNIDQEIATESARLQAENLLRESEHKYVSLFQLSPIPLGLVDVENGRIIEVNDIWQSQFGYRREEVIGYTAAELDLWDSPEQRSVMMDTLTKENKLDRFEIHHKSKSGTILICLMSARLFELSGGRVFIFSLLDVTRQYQVEQEIREMTAQLEARVRLRTLKLEQANTELAVAMESLKYTQDELIRSEKMAALGSLVAGVAHELNTPIGNSVTVASTLQDKTRELLRDITEGKLRRSTLEHYLQSAASGTALLMRTLGVARELIRSFKQVAVDQSSNQRRKFDLRLVLEEIIATLAPMYKKGPFTLATELESGVVMDSYPGPLGQIVTNFMTNALSHAFEGRNSGEMRISSHALDDEHVKIIFSDDGIGIGEAEQKRVFDPFFTTKLGQGGSGLGMNIVYNLVSGVLGGEIHLDSRPGEGTSFTLILPRSAPQISAEAEKDKPETLR